VNLTAFERIASALEKLVELYTKSQAREDEKWKLLKETEAADRAFKDNLLKQQEEQLAQQREVVKNGSVIANAVEEANRPEPWQRDPDEESDRG
jgi:hypothetical protein